MVARGAADPGQLNPLLIARRVVLQVYADLHADDVELPLAHGPRRVELQGRRRDASPPGKANPSCSPAAIKAPDDDPSFNESMALQPNAVSD